MTEAGAELAGYAGGSDLIGCSTRAVKANNKQVALSISSQACRIFDAGREHADCTSKRNLEHFIAGPQGISTHKQIAGGWVEDRPNVSAADIRQVGDRTHLPSRCDLIDDAAINTERVQVARRIYRLAACLWHIGERYDDQRCCAVRRLCVAGCADEEQTE